LSDAEITAIHAAGSAGMCGTGWHFVSTQVTNQVFSADLAGWPQQAILDLESSTNLTHWQWIETHSVSNGWFRFAEPIPMNRPVRFYRAVVR
jgi:hypothetical protein